MRERDLRRVQSKPVETSIYQRIIFLRFFLFLFFFFFFFDDARTAVLDVPHDRSARVRAVQPNLRAIPYKKGSPVS